MMEIIALILVLATWIWAIRTYYKFKKRAKEIDEKIKRLEEERKKLIEARKRLYETYFKATTTHRVRGLKPKTPHEKRLWRPEAYLERE